MAPLSNEVLVFLRDYYEATEPSREECPRCRHTAFVHRAWVADSTPLGVDDLSPPPALAGPPPRGGGGVGVASSPPTGPGGPPPLQGGRGVDEQIRLGLA